MLPANLPTSFFIVDCGYNFCMKRNIYLAACCFILLTYIQPLAAKSFTMITDTSVENQLTQTEKEQGWKLLFDGNTLTGWRTYKNKPGSWEVNNGMLCSERSES